MEQVVECSTRGENILDLFFTTHPLLVERTKTLPPLGKGDHDRLNYFLAGFMWVVISIY
jgi:hypothetical protein